MRPRSSSSPPLLRRLGFSASRQDPRQPRTSTAADEPRRAPCQRPRSRCESTRTARVPLRRASMPAEDDAVVFGVHSAVAEHYGVPAGTEAERATTLDYIVAAAAG